MTIPQKWFLREKHKNLSNIFQIPIKYFSNIQYSDSTIDDSLFCMQDVQLKPHLPLLLQSLVRSDGGAEVEADNGEDHGNLHIQRVSAFW